MEMETVSNSSISDCNRDMELLLEAFGSSFSLENIASAYSQASRNVEMAGVILYELQQTNALSCESKDDILATTVSPLELSSEDSLKYPYIAQENDKGVPEKTYSVPEKTYVSAFSGGESLKSTNGGSGIQFEMHSHKSLLAASCSNTGKDGSMHTGIEEFILEMLGDGFQFDMKKIREVLGLCGYDLEKSMETLVDLSASVLEKSDDVVSSCQNVYLKAGSISEDAQSSSSLSKGRLVTQRKKNKDKEDLQREILGALFSAPERVEQLPKKTSTGTRGVRTYGRTAVEPMKEIKIEETFVAVKPLASHNRDEEAEHSFLVLRQAVKENWATMKEYYKAATDAYTKGDVVLAHKLMKEGQYYNSLAREADEMSAKKLLETRDDEMLLDISTLELKEAIKLLKLHLSNLAGIPTFRFLKVSVGEDDKGNKKGSLKRLVLKLLEKESIHWNEEEGGKTIVIQLSEINPKNLSFKKK